MCRYGIHTIMPSIVGDKFIRPMVAESEDQMTVRDHARNLGTWLILPACDSEMAGWKPAPRSGQQAIRAVTPVDLLRALQSTRRHHPFENVDRPLQEQS